MTERPYLIDGYIEQIQQLETLRELYRRDLQVALDENYRLRSELKQTSDAYRELLTENEKLKRMVKE